MGGGGSKIKRYTRTVPHEPYTKPTSGSSGALFDNCGSVSFSTAIAKPTSVASKLHIGDLLDIALDPSGNIVLIDSTGATCGNIIGRYAQQLADCIRKGHEYSAKVIDTASPIKIEVQIKK